MGTVTANVLFSFREHATGTGCGVVDAPVNAWREDAFFIGKQQLHHQPDDFAGSKVVPGLFVGLLIELSDQLFEQIAHL